MKTMVFVSLPMRGYSDEEIIVRQEKIFGDFKADNPDSLLINPFRPSEGLEGHQITIQEAIGKEDVYMLGLSISNLSFADVAVFAKGWENYPGCRIEHKVCTYYDIPIKYA